MKKPTKIVYRFFDDNEEKHYVISSFSHKELEALLEKYKSKKTEVVAKEFISYLKRSDSEAEEVTVIDFYF